MITNTGMTNNRFTSPIPYNLDNVPESISNLAKSVIEILVKNFKPNVASRSRRSIDIPDDFNDVDVQKVKEKSLEGDCVALNWMLKLVGKIAELLQKTLQKFNKQTIQQEEMQREHKLLMDKISAQMDESFKKKDNVVNGMIETLTSDLNSVNAELSWKDMMQLYKVEQDASIQAYEMTDYICNSVKECLTFIKYNLKSQKMKYESSELAVTFKKQSLDAINDILQIFDYDLSVDATQKKVRNILDFVRDPTSSLLYCGQPPKLTKKLDGSVVSFKEGDGLKLSVSTTEKVYFHQQVHWFHNNKVVDNEFKTTLIKTLKAGDGGFYSCQISNKFGDTSCGMVEVRVYQKPVFVNRPEATTVYDKSPVPKPLLCNATHAETVEWIYESFNTLTSAPIKGENGIMLNIAARESGYYSCKASNQKAYVISEKVPVKVLKTSLAIPRLTIEMEVNKTSGNRRRRDISKINLAQTLNITEESIYKIELDQNSGKLKLIFQGSNLSSLLESDDNWNKVAELVVKEREKILAIAQYLDKLAREKKTLTKIDGVSYTINRNSMKSVPMPGACKDGQVLMDNGFVCGKSTLVID